MDNLIELKNILIFTLHSIGNPILEYSTAATPATDDSVYRTAKPHTTPSHRPTPHMPAPRPPLSSSHISVVSTSTQQSFIQIHTHLLLHVLFKTKHVFKQTQHQWQPSHVM